MGEQLIGGLYNKVTFANEKKYDQGIMVWGRSPLVLAKGRLNSSGYMSLLEDNEIFSSLTDIYGEKKIFSDGACHTSKKTINYIEDKIVQVIKNWLANSPDLTCFE